MVDELPEPTLDQGVEDTQSVENGIDSLYDKFIVPIDRLRSFAEAPVGLLDSNYKDKLQSDYQTDSVRPTESRCHTFYRMLGLPVIDSSGSFYNPGFDPGVKPEGQAKRDLINSKIDPKKRAAMETREDHSRNMRSVFAREDLNATLFALGVSLQPRSFGEFSQSDQSFTVTGRKEAIADEIASIGNAALVSSLLEASEFFANTPVGPGLDSGLHIITPMMVNPTIDFTVMPSNSKVCAPFLKDIVSTRISASPEAFLLRPGIEFIIRARLQDNEADPLFLQDLERILKQEKSGSTTFIADVNTNVLRSTLFALAEANKIDNVDINEIFSGFTTTQAQLVKQLIKTIKVLVNELQFAVSQIDGINDRISFLPIPSTEGLEVASKMGKIRDVRGAKPIEQIISLLSIKKLNADRDVSVQKGLGNFATPFMNLEKTTTYEEQLAEVVERRAALGAHGMRHLRMIEIITGEISGLGLVDILAIYTALWSIKIEDLLDLLDEDSFNRLNTFNPGLRTKDVNDRQQRAPAVVTAIEALEGRVKNILTFADSLYIKRFAAPSESEGGEP